MREYFKRTIPLILSVCVICSSIVPSVYAGVFDDALHDAGPAGVLAQLFGGAALFERVEDWLRGGSKPAVNEPQKYYTTPSSSVEDQYGNVTNYYRGGDTTNMKIIDSYNHTFNSIHNTTNLTNNYSANVKLSDFLNSYTTNNYDYTYNTEYNSWYYDQSTQNYTYDASQTYYNTDNSRYYITIDNSTDEYYLVDIQYSPTFVTVNYNYNNIYGDSNYGDVTNVYYFELTDGRNSSTLSVSDILGLDLSYDVVNYEMVADDPNVLSLQHFDGSYEDSSVYHRDFYSVNRSTTYVDSGAFGNAVKLPSGSAAGVTIPGLSDYESLMIDFRVYCSNFSNLGIWFGDTCLFSKIPKYGYQTYSDYYDDHGSSGQSLGLFCMYADYYPCEYDLCPDVAGYDLSELGFEFSKVIKSSHTAPTVDQLRLSYSNYFGYWSWDCEPYVSDQKLYEKVEFDLIHDKIRRENDGDCYICEHFIDSIRHEVEYQYRAEPQTVIETKFSYDQLVNQWVSMRIVLSGGQLYYFVNGDLVGSGAFEMPEADKFYIKSSGTLYLDELRISTGDMVSTSPYNPAIAPYDTNKVLALPDDPPDLTIYVRHSCPVSAWRIGGVRPSNPETGFFYIPIHADYTGSQSQIYDGNNWVDVDSVVVENGDTYNTLGYTFSPVSLSPDIDVDAKPGGSGSGTTSNCEHDWKRTESVDATCKVTGKATYTCTKCNETKTEVLPLVSHAWTVKTSVPTTYDDSGNILTEGYTIYRCDVCGEEYKDTDGSGPPLVKEPTTDDSDASDDGSWLSKVGQAILDFFDLIGKIVKWILDGILSLFSTAVELLNQVLDLFGAFGEALRALWGWLPDEVITVLVAGVAVVVLAAIIKLFV